VKQSDSIFVPGQERKNMKKSDRVILGDSSSMMSHELYQNHTSSSQRRFNNNNNKNNTPRMMANENAFCRISITFQDDEKETKADVFKA